MRLQPRLLYPARRWVRILLVDLALTGWVAVTVYWGARLWGDPAWPSGRTPPFGHEFWIVMTGAGLALVLRHRHGALALLLAAVLVVAWPVLVVPFAATASAVIVRRERRRVAVLLVLAGFATSVAAFALVRLSWPTLGLFVLVTCVLCLALPLMVHRVLDSTERRVARLQALATDLAETREVARSVARHQERARIAQQVHDRLGQRLTAVTLHAGALERTLTEGSVGAAGTPGAEQARVICATVHDALGDLRILLGAEGGAQPSAQERAEPSGRPLLGRLRDDLERLVDVTAGTGIPVRLGWVGDVDLPMPDAARRVVHAAVREGLTNVQRHAPGARVEITVTVDAGQGVAAEVVDSPVRPAVVAGSGPCAGLGLTGVARQAREAGGSCSFGPTPHGGYRLAVWVPLGDSAAAPSRAPVRTAGVSGFDAAVVRAMATGLLLVLLPGGMLLTQSAVMLLEPPPPERQPPPLGITRAELEPWTGPAGDPLVTPVGQWQQRSDGQPRTCLYTLRELRRSDLLAWRYCLEGGRLVSVDSVVAKVSVSTGPAPVDGDEPVDDEPADEHERGGVPAR